MTKTIQGGERTLILKVLKFFENEKKNRKYCIPVDQVIKRTCMATGISKATLLRIKNEASKELEKQRELSTTPNGESNSNSDIIPLLSTPGKKRKPSARKIVLNDSDVCALKNIINNFYTRKKVPTLNEILDIAKQEFNFPGKKSTLRNLLKNQLGIRLNGSGKACPALIQKSTQQKQKIKVEPVETSTSDTNISEKTEVASVKQEHSLERSNETSFFIEIKTESF